MERAVDVISGVICPIMSAARIVVKEREGKEGMDWLVKDYVPCLLGECMLWGESLERCAFDRKTEAPDV